jgi:hypothetical protein
MYRLSRRSKAKDRGVILSTLWIFAVLNYAYADIFGLYFNPALLPDVTKQLAAGYVGGTQVTQGFALAFAILMETAIAMVLLSRVLAYGANRWANVIVGVIQTASVSWSLIGPTNVFYWFFAVIEIACTLFVVWYAWTWPAPDRESESDAIDRDEYPLASRQTSR